jgi:hypothetical protein
MLFLSHFLVRLEIKSRVNQSERVVFFHHFFTVTAGRRAGLAFTDVGTPGSMTGIWETTPFPCFPREDDGFLGYYHFPDGDELLEINFHCHDAVKIIIFNLVRGRTTTM